MDLNLQEIQEVLQTLYVPKVCQAFGNGGPDILRIVLTEIRKIFTVINPEICTGRIVIYKSIEPNNDPFPGNSGLEIPDQTHLNVSFVGTRVFEILPNGRLKIWNNFEIDCLAFSKVALIYEYSNRSEKFFAGGQEIPVAKVIDGYASMFCTPTFDNILEALNSYREIMVRKCTCGHLREVWENNNRLFFNAGPESKMRQSLTFFLMSHLGSNFEVRPEQIVDETHPVDIKVTKLYSRSHALIEIKWLGKSKKETGEISTDYHDGRAREGAKQLADYLDADAQHAPTKSNRGYLVVIDGRRYGLNETHQSINSSNGLHYENIEIDFNPKYETLRNDFETPLRMFIEPICEAAISA